MYVCTYLQEVGEHTVVQCQQHQPKLEVYVTAQLELGVVKEPLPPPRGWSQSDVEVGRKENNQAQHKPVFKRDRGREREVGKKGSREKEGEGGREGGGERESGGRARTRKSHCSVVIQNHKTVTYNSLGRTS